jgi:DNA-3-methyladenine glycosylase II
MWSSAKEAPLRHSPGRGKLGTGSQKLSVTKGVLPARPPFDFGLTLEFLRRFEPMAGEQAIAGESLTKALRMNGRTVVFRVTGAKSDGQDGVAFALISDGPLPAALRRQIQDRIAFFLSLDDDLEPFYRLAESDPRMAEAVDRLRGLHQVKFMTPFENTAWAVLAQRVAIPVARRMKLALVERFGSSLEVDGQVHWAFPEPDDLATTTEDELAGVIRNRVRARALGSVVDAFRTADEQWLRTASYDDAESWLRNIHGVGPWSAAFVLFRGLGRIERLPLTPPMLRAARGMYGAGASDDEIRAVAERYGEWCGYWSMYSRVGV